MKNLAIFIYSLAGGGAERVVSILLQELKSEFDITLVLMNDTISFEIPKETKIIYLENSNPTENGLFKLVKLPYLGYKYKKLCQKNKIDTSLVFMNRPSYIAIFAKIFGLKAESIISERSTPSQIYAKNTLTSKANRFLIRNLYPKADKIITNSQGNRDDLIENFQIPPSKTVTIYNPFDIEKIESLSKEDVEGIDFSKFTFISVGRVDEGKNHQMIIEAFSKLKSENMQLIILGEGDLKQSLHVKIEEYNLTSKVFLLGFDANPYRYMSKSDCFVFASRFEGFPNVLVEAMACGLPVISTNCKSGPAEILKDGILIDVDDKKAMIEAMRDTITNTALRESLHVKSLKRAKEFDKEKIIKQFIYTCKL